MESDPYSNRELDVKFDALKELILEKFNDLSVGQEKIIVQTTLHNGRMSRTEKTLLVVITAVIVLTLSRPDVATTILKLIAL